MAADPVRSRQQKDDLHVALGRLLDEMATVDKWFERGHEFPQQMVATVAANLHETAGQIKMAIGIVRAVAESRCSNAATSPKPPPASEN